MGSGQCQNAESPSPQMSTSRYLPLLQMAQSWSPAPFSWHQGSACSEQLGVAAGQDKETRPCCNLLIFCRSCSAWPINKQLPRAQPNSFLSLHVSQWRNEHYMAINWRMYKEHKGNSTTYMTKVNAYFKKDLRIKRKCTFGIGMLLYGNICCYMELSKKMWRMQTHLIHVHFLYQEIVKCQFKRLQNSLGFSVSIPLQEGAEKASSEVGHTECSRLGQPASIQVFQKTGQSACRTINAYFH